MRANGSDGLMTDIEHAAKLLADADALVIAAGAGMVWIHCMEGQQRWPTCYKTLEKAVLATCPMQ